MHYFTTFGCNISWRVHAVLQVAQQLFPGHVVLQLATPVRTSSLQARLLQAANSSAGVLVVLGPAAGAAAGGKPGVKGSLIVDVPIRPRKGASLVLATPAALAAAAAAGVKDVADAGHAARLAQLQLRSSQLLPVRCRASKGGTFIEARWAAATRMSGIVEVDCMLALRLETAQLKCCFCPTAAALYST
jgi:hypothetical protein